jgi:hypothetical protein
MGDAPCEVMEENVRSDLGQVAPNVREKHMQKMMRQPGVEPGTSPWKGLIIPLNYWR